MASRAPMRQERANAGAGRDRRPANGSTSEGRFRGDGERREVRSVRRQHRPGPNEGLRSAQAACRDRSGRKPDPACPPRAHLRSAAGTAFARERPGSLVIPPTQLTAGPGQGARPPRGAVGRRSRLCPHSASPQAASSGSPQAACPPAAYQGKSWRIPHCIAKRSPQIGRHMSAIGRLCAANEPACAGLTPTVGVPATASAQAGRTRGGEIDDREAIPAARRSPPPPIKRPRARSANHRANMADGMAGAGGLPGGLRPAGPGCGERMRRRRPPG